MAKTKKPTGLSLARKDNQYTAKWKITAKDYGDGQNMKWRARYNTFKTVKGKKTAVHHDGSWNDIDIGKTTTSKALTASMASFYPNKAQYLYGIQFAVQGNQKKYKTTKKKKTVTVNNSMSDWSYCQFDISAPDAPTMSTEIGTWPSATFTMTNKGENTDHKPFTRLEYTAVLLKNSNVTDGKNVNWSTIRGRQEGTQPSRSKTLQITEDSGMLSDGNSYTRWVRCRSVGPGGPSAWVYAKHVYALSNRATITKVDLADVGAAYNAKVYFDMPMSTARPVKEVRVEWVIDTPIISGTTITPDPDASWQTGATVKPKDKTSGAIFAIGSQVGEDEYLFFRAVSVYDDQDNPGEPYAKLGGKMAKPTGLSVSLGDDYQVDVSATNNSDVVGSYLIVRYYDAERPNGIDIGRITSADPVTVQCPEFSSLSNVVIGVYATAGSYDESTSPEGITYYTPKLAYRSDVTKSGGSVPVAPANVSAFPTQQTGTIKVVWDWSWASATGAELSWADHPDAWESTNEPQTYTVRRLKASAWNISGLETGKVWYVRVRLFQETDGVQTFGAYSDMQTVNLASAPLVPALQLSSAIITVDGEVTATWGYSTTDGTAQAGAIIAEAVLSGGVYSYTKIDEVQTQQSYTINAAEQGWHVGETHLIAVRVMSGSGLESDDWSAPVGVTIAAPVTCTITGTSLDEITQTTTDEEGNTVTLDVTALTELPLTVTVSGAYVEQAFTGDGETVAFTLNSEVDSGLTVTVAGEITEDYTVTDNILTFDDAPDLGAAIDVRYIPSPVVPDTTTKTLIVERAETYIVDRPDETDFNVYKGETIVLQSGDGSFTVGLNDLIGRLDDGAAYNLIATVEDGLGQSATQTIPFVVAWSHQAEAPTATVAMDTEYMAAFLTPVAPDNYEAGDVCDIYRLSADRPQLIYEGAQFGQTYVDPYPAIGEFGGHRFVTRTKDGDYITADNQFAWYDTGENEGDNLDVRFNMIDFGDGRADLTYDCDINNDWQKDFEQTAYLGGSVQGDWNKAVKRSGTVNATAVQAIEGDTMQTMRRLADYAGICHVRTKDGSSYAADVQVGEKYNYASGIKQTDYTLKITRIEPQELDGMTLAEWQNVHDEDESE